MTHEEKRLYLIKELLSELPQYRNMEIPENTEEQKRLLRSLMNIRSPRPIGEEFLKLWKSSMAAAAGSACGASSEKMACESISSTGRRHLPPPASE